MLFGGRMHMSSRMIWKRNSSFFSFKLMAYVTMSGIYRGVKTSIETLNFFKSYPPSTDPLDLADERISTRVFIVLLILLIIVLSAYTSLVAIQKVETVKTPSLSKYQSLYDKYGALSVTCFCTTVAIPYKTFITVEPIFHQLCSSQFVSSNWIDYLIYVSQSAPSKNDFRQIGPRMFQLLADICRLTNDEVISNSLTAFYSKKYITGLVQAKNIFNVTVNEIINVFKSSAGLEFLSALDVIRLTTSGNQLMSNLYTSSYNERRQKDEIQVPIMPMQYSDNCSCQMSFNCTQVMTLKNISSGDEFEIAGLRVGCYVVEALMQSTLECFYNSICLNQVQSIINYSAAPNITALSPSFTSHPNSTVQRLIEQFMIDQWSESVSYSSYYEKCQPSHCTATYNGRNDLIYIVTFLIGMVGGLTSVLVIIVPPLVKFMRRNKRNTSSQLNPSKTDHAGGDDFFCKSPENIEAHFLLRQTISFQDGILYFSSMNCSSYSQVRRTRYLVDFWIKVSSYKFLSLRQNLSNVLEYFPATQSLTMHLSMRIKLCLIKIKCFLRLLKKHRKSYVLENNHIFLNAVQVQWSKTHVCRKRPRFTVEIDTIVSKCGSIFLSWCHRRHKKLVLHDFTVPRFSRTKIVQSLEYCSHLHACPSTAVHGCEREWKMWCQ